MDDQLSLPGMDPPPPVPEAAIDQTQEPRLRRVDRAQVRMTPCSLDESLPADHPVREVWAVVQRLDCSKFESGIRARGSAPGRAATDPRVLLALWLYATIDGVGSGREIDRLVHVDDRYRWLAGGVSLDYHLVNDFRVRHEVELDDLFTQVVAALVKQGLVEVTRLSQDGIRVRAGAGSDSFRSESSLRTLLEEARTRIGTLKHQNDPSFSARQQAKRLADAQDRAARIEAALELLPGLQAAHEQSCKRRGEEPAPVRVSTTDPQARKMKVADGGYRPAYNVQLAMDTQSRVIVGVDVTGSGVDSAQATPMRQQVEQRTGQRVKEHLMDGGYASLDSIDEAEKAGVTVYAPVSKKCQNRNPQADPYARKKDDTDETFAWRQRMQTDEAKAIYKLRGSTIETINADLAQHRGLRQFPVRGPTKVRCVALLMVLAHNLLRFATELITDVREKS
jgi:transposase